MVPKWCPDVKNKVVKRKTATITRYKKSLCLQGFSQITYKKICGNTGRFWLFHDPRNQVVAQAARGFESHPIRHDHASSRFFRLLAFLFARNQTGGQYQPRADTPSQTTFAVYTAKAMKRLVRGTSAKVTYQLHEPFQSMGSVSVTGKNIDMKKEVWFVRSAELAQSLWCIPKRTALSV